MTAPIFDRPPATRPPATRRRLSLLVVGALAVAAVLGTGVALATRSSDHPATRPAAAATGAAAMPASGVDATASTQPTAQPAKQTGSGETGDDAKPEAETKDRGPAPADTARGVAVLPDGVHHALIRRVDAAHDRITVDVVQLFLDDDAAKAALADGKPREEAQAMTVWLRNQNPRLRALPLAADLKVDFFHPCDWSPDRRVVLRRLAENASRGQYFYSLTVRGGAVHAIRERQIVPAC